jgi:transposase
MANKPITMLQVRQIIKLHGQGLSTRGISRKLGIHRRVLDKYIGKISSSGLPPDEILKMDDAALSKTFYNKQAPRSDGRFPVLEQMFPYIRQELAKTGVTRRTVWEEYRAQEPDGYSYGHFCEHLARELKIGNATMHFEHQPADFLQVDFAGKRLSYIDGQTGEVIDCPVLVCTLAYSNYTYVEALATAKQEEMFGAMNRCLEFFGGAPKNVLSDNMKQYVQKNERYEFTFQDLAGQWAFHYDTNLDATRPRKPKDKPTVENHVYISYLRIYAKLRAKEFYSLGELNMGIMGHLADLNSRKFQKLEGSRLQRFSDHEKGQLSPLPAEPFAVKRSTMAKVQMNYHVVLGEDRHQYSVPYQYIGKQAKIIYDQETVEVYAGLERIALHKRDYRKNFYTTHDEHMPEKHLRYKETKGWDAEYFMKTALNIGTSSTEVFKQVLASKIFVEQTYKACVGLKALSEKYKHARFEAACKRALLGTRVNYGVVKRILEHNLDLQEGQQLDLFHTQEHENVRGPMSYN